MVVEKLPAPAELAMPLKDCLMTRRSNREPSSSALAAEELSALLFACAGFTDDDGRRVTPSTLDLRCVNAYVLRPDGAWRYNAQDNTLEQTTDKDVREVSTLYQFDLVKTAYATIVFVVDKVRAEKARPTAPYVDAGTMAQSCSLAAASLGLAGVVRASFDHEALRVAMNLADTLEPIVVYTVGKRPA